MLELFNQKILIFQYTYSGSFIFISQKKIDISIDIYVIILYTET